MSCCCAPDEESSAPLSRGKIEFSKVCSSGFEKERKTVYYSDDDEKSPCDKARSDSSIVSGYSDQQDSEEDIGDMVFVDGNEADLDECDDEDTLMERVWWLSKPPYVPRQTPVVSARRIQIIKERLSATVKGPLTTRSSAKKSIQGRGRSMSREYVIVGKFSTNSQVACGTTEQTSIPVCARKLSDMLL